MAFNINRIKAAIESGNGPAKENTYSVYIVPPAGVLGNFPQLQYLCDSAELPGRQMLSTPQVIYGTQRKMPYGAIYNDLALTFICTNSMAERKAFESWQSLIQDPTNNYMNYYDDYTGHITIQKFNDQSQETHYVICEEVYPILIEPQQLSWQPSTDKPLGLRVSFAYLKWRSHEDIVRGGGNSKGFTPDFNAIPRDFTEEGGLQPPPAPIDPNRFSPNINSPKGVDPANNPLKPK
jgi:hypothetical protein